MALERCYQYLLILRWVKFGRNKEKRLLINKYIQAVDDSCKEDDYLKREVITYHNLCDLFKIFIPLD